MTDTLRAVLITFGTALIPGLELRAGIPAGMALGLPAPVAVTVAVISNTLQIFLALAVVGYAYRYARRSARVQAWLEKAEVQALKHKALIRRWGSLGLAAFVLLPLPGTGVFGGVVLARLLQVPAPSMWAGIALGISLSGVVFGLGFQGLFSLFR